MAEAEHEWVSGELQVDLEEEILRLYKGRSFLDIAKMVGSSERVVSKAAHWMAKQGRLTLRTKDEERIMAWKKRIANGNNTKPPLGGYSMTTNAVGSRRRRAKKREERLGREK